MIDMALFAILSVDPDVIAIVGGAGAVKIRAEFTADLPPCVVYGFTEKRSYYASGEAYALREFVVEVESHADGLGAHDKAEALATAVFNALVTKQTFPVTAGGVFVRQICPNDDREDATQSPADGKSAVHVRTESFDIKAFIPVNVVSVHDNGDQTATWTFANATALPVSKPLKVQGDYSAFKVSDGTLNYAPTAAALVAGGVKFTYTNGAHALTAWSVTENTGLAFNAGVLALSQSGATS